MSVVVSGAAEEASGYRPDIDGLRALAVLSVMLFHVGFGAFSGGYVGVDVFFVISGFLITRLIRDEVLRTGSFRFSHFYMRRARRLLPAMFATFVGCFVAAFLLFSPADFERFGGALMHAVASLSNFFFWNESGYFDAASNVKPLLHTWSLAVEEQFYLVWPACLVFMLLKLPRVVLPIALIAGGIASLALNLVLIDGESATLSAWAPRVAGWFSDGPATIYYLAPFRIFEFAIGAGMVWLVERPPNRVVAEFLAGIGLVMIAIPVFTYTEATPFPSTAALLPCAGTALVIQARSARFATGMLGSRPFVALGLISYSLYLVHWPISVFYRYATDVALSSAEQAGICLVSIALAALMYRFVETPFRRGAKAADAWSPGSFGLACALCALVISFPAASAWANRGWAWRFGAGAGVEVFSRIDALSAERLRYLAGKRLPYFTSPASVTRVLVVGDSVSDDLYIALSENLGPRFEVQSERYVPRCSTVFANTAATSAECAEILRTLEYSQKVRDADEIHVAVHGQPGRFREELEPLFGFLSLRAKPEARFVLHGRTPAFTNFQAVAVSMLGESRPLAEIEAEAYRRNDHPPGEDQAMREFAATLGIGFVSKYDLLCVDGTCKYFTDGGSLMFWDELHLSVAGATWYGGRLVSALSGAGGTPGLSLARTTSATSEHAERGSTAAAPAAAPPAVEMSVDEAVEVVQSYGALLGGLTLDGSSVHDAGLLPEPKGRIIAAILTMLPLVRDDAAGQEMLRGAAFTLGFFQAGVGDNAQPVDAASPDGPPWRERVEAEVADLMTAVEARSP